MCIYIYIYIYIYILHYTIIINYLTQEEYTILRNKNRDNVIIATPGKVCFLNKYLTGSYVYL